MFRARENTLTHGHVETLACIVEREPFERVRKRAEGLVGMSEERSELTLHREVIKAMAAKQRENG